MKPTRRLATAVMVSIAIAVSAGCASDGGEENDDDAPAVSTPGTEGETESETDTEEDTETDTEEDDG